MNKVMIRTLLVIMTAFVISLSFSIKTEAEAKQEIVSMDDFYDKLSEQIYNRVTVRNYIVNDRSLMKSIVSFSWNEYENHYREDAPLASGCYTTYYIDKIYYSYRGSDLRITIDFPYSEIDMKNHFSRLANLATDLKGKNDYETVKNVHDYLIDHFEYDEGRCEVNHADIEGFRDGVMVCSGYGLAAYYLLNSAGVKTRIVIGYGGNSEYGNQNHLWNLVCLDGKWYNMDVTWDDLSKRGKSYKYFLKSDKDFPDHTRVGTKDNTEINSLVSKTSYPLPLSLTFPTIFLEHGVQLIFAAVIIFTLLAVYFRRIRARNNTYVVQGTYNYNNNSDSFGYNGYSGQDELNGLNGQNVPGYRQDGFDPVGYSGQDGFNDGFDINNPL
ncbi:MAG: hypothetical protein IJ619_02780 [Eubacterium sp.]|nr:hypothetical protein [Eubacterium sp.]